MTGGRIGILGSGDVGRALAAGFARHGWDALVGTRSPEELAAWVSGAVDAAPDGAVAAGSFAEAAGHGDVAVLAVRGGAAESVLDLAGPGAFDGTLLLDASNPLTDEWPPALLYGGTESLGERVQAALPEAAVVKCFNTVSHVQMVDPDFEAETPPMLICGNDAAAKERTEAILAEFGWPGAVDVGGIDGARYLEALVPLWARVGRVLDTYEHAFAVAR